MNLKSKYDCQQIVWHRSIGTKEIRSKCPDCDGGGSLITKSGNTQICNNCLGKGYESDWVHDVPVVRGPYTIGQIRIEYTAKSDNESDFSNFGRQEERTVVQYMMYETGIGSGSVYYEDSLFASEELALSGGVSDEAL